MVVGILQLLFISIYLFAKEGSFLVINKRNKMFKIALDNLLFRLRSLILIYLQNIFHLYNQCVTYLLSSGRIKYQVTSKVHLTTECIVETC